MNHSTTRLIVTTLTIGWLAACAAPPARQPVAAPEPTTAVTLAADDPLRACISMFRFDGDQAAGSTEFPTLWTFSMNFRAFNGGDKTQPYACLKVYERQGTGSSANYVNAVTKSVQSDPSVPLDQDVLGIPIPCQVNGTMDFETTTTEIMPAFRPSGYVTEPLGVAKFAPGSGYIACEVDLQKIVADAIASGQIKMTTTALTATMLTTYTYSTFAIGTAGILTTTEGHTILEHRPNERVCNSVIQNANTYCQPTAQRIEPITEKPFNMVTVLNSKPFGTPDVFYAVREFEGMLGKPCNTSAEQGKPYIRWSYLGADLPDTETSGSSSRGFGLYHYLYETTNTTKLVGCYDKMLAEGAVVDFFTGPVTIFIGGTPQGNDKWEGELYEVIIDPPGGSGGTDKAQ